MKFEWDSNKERRNIQKHGISFRKASYVFADPFALSIFDDKHSEIEDRWVLLGKVRSEVILVIIHTFREKGGIEYIRIISARKATRTEEQIYQENTRFKKVSEMKEEYDFSNAEQGKFYRPIEELEIPIYLDKEVREFFMASLKNKESETSLSEIVNSLLKQNIEIIKNLAG